MQYSPARMGLSPGSRIPRLLGTALITLALTYSASADLLPFPLTAGQRGTVTCLEHPEIAYDVYLPPGYSTNGAPLPIFYTFSSTGGGMNGVFLSALSQSNIIGIGMTDSRNSAPAGTMERQAWAVTRDLRKRILFDPTAQMAGGISGGGWSAFDFTRMEGQHISGVFEMAGWLGVNSGSPYPSTKREQTNLFIAWTVGDTDGSGYIFPYDSNYLATVCGDTLNYWTFSGGHVAPPTDVQLQCFGWMLTNRIPPGPTDQADSQARLANWRARTANGDLESVLRECVGTLMGHPRSWDALQAQIVLDELESNYDAFRTINIANFAQGDFAVDMFYNNAYGAAYAADLVHYHSLMRCLTGVSGSSGDHLTDIHNLLVSFGFPAPLLRTSYDPFQNVRSLFTYKDAPGMTYLLQSRTNFTGAPWQTRAETPFDTDMLWSTTVYPTNAAGIEFYRLATQTIYQSNQIPTITSQPQSQTAYEGTTVAIKVTTSGPGLFGYQWRKEGVNLLDGDNVATLYSSVPGAATSTLLLSKVSRTDAGNYDAVVTGYTNVTSAAASLTVLPFSTNQLPTIVSQPQSSTNYEGVNVTFSVAAGGTGPFGYQWRKNGVEMRDSASVVGSYTPTLTLLNVSQTDTATYDVVVIGYTNAISDPATLAVVPFAGTLLLYEPFDYPNIGGLVSTNNTNNWVAGGSGSDDTRVESGNLSWPGLATSLGNCLTNGGAGLAQRRLFHAGISSGTVYFSTLLQINDFGTFNGSGSQLCALTAADNLSFRLQVMVKGGSSGYTLGVQKGGTGATPVYDFTNHRVGDVLFIVGKYDFTTTPNIATLWINPDSSTFGAASPPGTNYITSTAGSDNLVIDRFNFRQNTATTIPANVKWDELRVGLSWADVTPTPF